MRLSSSLAAGLGPSSARLAMRTQCASHASAPHGEELRVATRQSRRRKQNWPTASRRADEQKRESVLTDLYCLFDAFDHARRKKSLLRHERGPQF